MRTRARVCLRIHDEGGGRWACFLIHCATRRMCNTYRIESHTLRFVTYLILERSFKCLSFLLLFFVFFSFFSLNRLFIMLLYIRRCFMALNLRVYIHRRYLSLSRSLSFSLLDHCCFCVKQREEPSRRKKETSRCVLGLKTK